MVYYATLIPHAVAMLAHLAGLAIAIFLLVRTKSKAAILAAVGFGLLALVDLGQIVQSVLPLGGQLSRWLPWVLSCCCSMFDLAAIVCLIVALWQAVSGTSAGDKTTPEPLDDIETWEEEEGEQDVISDEPEQAPDDVIYAPAKLDTPEALYATEVMEGEILQDAPPENLYATKVLRETLEDVSATEEDVSATEEDVSATEEDVSATEEANDENK